MKLLVLTLIFGVAIASPSPPLRRPSKAERQKLYRERLERLQAQELIRAQQALYPAATAVRDHYPTDDWEDANTLHHEVTSEEDHTYFSSVEALIDSLLHKLSNIYSFQRSSAAPLGTDDSDSKVQQRITETLKKLAIDYMSTNYFSINEEQAMNKNGRENSGNSGNFFDLTQIWHYGCWCNFGREGFDGKGTPKNRVDYACRNMTLCMRCITIDAVQDGYACDPLAIEYLAPLAKPGDSTNIAEQCTRSNNRKNIPEHNCKVHTCACESQFAAELVEMFFDGVPFEPEFKHDNGFDKNVECSSKIENHNPTEPELGPGAGGRGLFGPETSMKPMPHVVDQQCCGLYPQRKPYDANKKACCEAASLSFNPNRYDCCADGTIRQTGSC